MAKKTTEKKTILPDLPKHSSFQEDVWDVVRQIPKGRITSYGAIAKYLGLANGARQVGWAMGNAPKAKPKIPAQRVVNSTGKLTAKNQFPNNGMEKMLQKDGVEIKNDAVVNFKKLFWDPAEELQL